MNSENEVDPYGKIADHRTRWHPKIEFTLWIFDGIVVAMCYAFVWQYMTMPELFDSAVLKENIFIAIGARAGWIMAALAFFFVAILIVECWYRIVVQHTKAEYEPSSHVMIISVFSIPFLIVLVSYLWFSIWALEAIWNHLVIPKIVFDTDPVSKQYDLSWSKIILWVGFAIALCGALLWMLLLSFRAVFSHYAAALRHYAFLGTIKGMLIMLLMRMKSPRKDFFLQTPVINNAFFFAISIWIYILIPIHGVNLIAATLLATLSVIYTLDIIAPPVWLFLGASSYESAFVFHDLRRIWRPRVGVTLLDRDNPAWSAHYLYEAQQLRKHGVALANFLNNPSTPRKWSLRTRDNLWKNAVLVLMDFVVVNVIDARIVRDGLQEELDWVLMSGRVDKTWILGVNDKDAPALIDALSEEVDADDKIKLLIECVVSGHRLYEALWEKSGLQIPTSSGQRV